MTRYTNYLVMGCLLMISLLSACGASDDKPVEKSDLTGVWELVYAERDGKQTETLTDLFLHFEGEDRVITNFNGIDTTNTAYNLTDKKLEVLDTQPYAFDVLSIEDDIMILEINIRDILFEMHFRRI